MSSAKIHSRHGWHRDLRYPALTDNPGSIVEACGSTPTFDAPGTGGDWRAEDARQSDTPTGAFGPYIGRGLKKPVAIDKEPDHLVATGGFVHVRSRRRRYARFFGALCVLWTFGSLIAAMLLRAGWPDVWHWPYLTGCIVLTAHSLDDLVGALHDLRVPATCHRIQARGA